MGSVDFPAVISAAATSSLGVLSLIVLAISLLAYGFFRNAGETARLIVFAPLLLAAVAFGVSVVRESGKAQNRVGEGAQSASTPIADASAGAAGQAAASVPAAPASQLAIDASAEQAIAGNWRDDDGFTYRFSASGGRVSYVQLQGGEPVGSGDGTLVGRTLSYRYVDARTNDRGTCEGRLATSGKVIDGRCSSGSNSWGFKIVRDAA